MPINLTDFPQAWYTDQELEADDDVYPKLDTNEVDVDPEDAFLLSDILEKLPANAANGSMDPNKAPGVIDSTNVTWLRRTEYLAAEEKKRKRDELMSKGSSESIDTSREAQVYRIKEAFRLANAPLSSIRHPTKSHLKAVGSYSLLPDPDTWATQYDVFRFGDLPGRLKDNKPLADPRLTTSILRPHFDLVGQPLYSLFLIDIPQVADEEATAEAEEENLEKEEDIFGEGDDEEGGDGSDRKNQAKRPKVVFRSLEETIQLEDEESKRATRMRAVGMSGDAEKQDAEEAPFDTEQSEEDGVLLGHVRDYEAHDESTRKDQELILTFIDDVASGEHLPPVVQFERSYRQTSESEADSKVDQTGVVYYHPVSLRASMRVKRRRANDPLPPEHWDSVRLGKRSLSMYEKIDRLHVRSTVDDMDPMRLPERIEIPVEDDADVEDVEETADAEHDDVDVHKDGEEIDTVAGPKADGQDQTADEEEDQGQDGSNSEGDEDQSGSGSEGAQSDEEMDDDELAALQAEAGADAAQDDEAEGGGRRRSRRAAVDAADQNNAEQKPRELLSMDVDEED